MHGMQGWFGEEEGHDGTAYLLSPTSVVMDETKAEVSGKSEVDGVV